MAEGNNNKNPFKIWETVGKELLTGVLHEVVEKNYLKLEDSEKKKFYDAELRDKPRVLEASLRRKRDEAGQVLAEVFFNKENLPTDCKVLPESKVELDESADTLKPCPPEDFLRLCKERAGEVYPIKAKEDRTRLALIICNIAFESLPLRRGAEVDIEGMKTLLEDLGYSVHVEKHLTAQNMQSVLRAFAARPEHRSSDSTFLVFMSHGLLEGICGIKHNKQQPDVLLYDTIFQIFNNQNCGSLKDKPKVIIVQACRGVRDGTAYVRDSPLVSADYYLQSSKNLEEDAVSKTHVEKDFIAFYSTTPHNISWRSETEGSIFITKLITCFKKYSWCCHLEELFRKVQKSFEIPTDNMQMPTIGRNSMTRYFYLFPGN